MNAENYSLINEDQETLNYIIAQAEKLGLNDDPFKLKDGIANNNANNNTNVDNNNGNGNGNDNGNQNENTGLQDVNASTKDAQKQANQALNDAQAQKQQELQQLNNDNQNGDENQPNDNQENNNDDNNNDNQQSDNQNNADKKWVLSTDKNYKPAVGCPVYYYDSDVYENNLDTEDEPQGAFEKDNGEFYVLNGNSFAKYNEDDPSIPILMYPKEQAEEVQYNEDGSINNTDSEWIKGDDPNYRPRKNAQLFQYNEEIFNGATGDPNLFGNYQSMGNNNKNYIVKNEDGAPIAYTKDQIMYKASDAESNSNTQWIRGGEANKPNPKRLEMLYDFDEEIYNSNGPESSAHKMGFFISEDDSNYTYKPIKEDDIKQYTINDFTDNKKANLEIFKKLAISYSAPGLYPSVTVAQALHESGWGTSDLFKKTHNCFGIHSHGYSDAISGTDVDAEGKTYATDYRTYKTINYSFLNRIKFLAENPRYSKAGLFDASSPEEQIQKLKDAGYAQDPDYVKKLINLIQQNNLKELDSQVDNSTMTVEKQNAMYLSSKNSTNNGISGNGSNNNNNNNNKDFDTKTESESMVINGYIRGDNLQYIPKPNAQIYVVDENNPKNVVPSANGTFKYRLYAKKGETGDNSKKIQVSEYFLSKGHINNPKTVWYKKEDADGIGQKYVKNEKFPIKYGQESEYIRNIQNEIFTDNKCKDGRFGPVMLDIFNKVYNKKIDNTNRTNNALTQTEYVRLSDILQKNNNIDTKEKISGTNNEGLIPKSGAEIYANKDCNLYILNNGHTYTNGRNKKEKGSLIGYMGDISDIVKEKEGTYYKIRLENGGFAYVKADDIAFERGMADVNNETWLAKNFSQEQLKTLKGLILWYKNNSNRNEQECIGGALFDMEEENAKAKNRTDLKATFTKSESNSIKRRNCSYDDIVKAMGTQEKIEQEKPHEMTFVLERQSICELNLKGTHGGICGTITLNGENVCYTLEKPNKMPKPGKYKILMERSWDRDTKYTNKDKKDASYIPNGDGTVTYGEYVYGNDKNTIRRDKENYFRMPTLSGNGIDITDGIQIHAGKNLGWTKGCILISTKKVSSFIDGFDWNESVTAYHKFWNLIRKDFDKDFKPIEGCPVWIEIKNNF